MALRDFALNLGNDYADNSELNSLLRISNESLSVEGIKGSTFSDSELDPFVNEYLNSSEESNSLYNFDALKTFEKDIDDISINVGGILATGGYFALMEYYKDNPEKSKKITKVALGIGVLDTFIEKNDTGFHADLSLSPLLVASIAYFIFDVAKSSNDPKIQKLASQFSGLLGKGLKVVEFAGYAALTFSVIIHLSDIGLLGESGEQILDLLDNLGDATSLVEDGLDILTGIGLGFLLKRGVKAIGNYLGKDDVKRMESLTASTASKLILVKLLEANAPLVAIMAPYNDVHKKKHE